MSSESSSDQGSDLEPTTPQTKQPLLATEGAAEKVKLAEALTQKEGWASFCTGGSVQLPLPGISLEGVGVLPLPLTEPTVELIRRDSSLALCGKGSENVLDLAIRNSLQLDISKVAILNPRWKQQVLALAQQVTEALGIHGNTVDAVLHKVLLYERGNFFRAHKDAEKAEGMFATLSIQLPSVFTGGCYMVRHGGAEQIFRMGADDESAHFECQYVAHYCDCEHEIQEVTSGYRFVLIYSLYLKDAKPRLPIRDVQDRYQQSSRLADLFENIDACVGTYLGHDYTTSSLARFGFNSLKGKDRTLVDALMATSAVLKQRAAGSELIIHVCFSSIVGSSYEDRDPVVALGRGEYDGYEVQVYRQDGSPPDDIAIGILSGLNFIEDILDHLVPDENGELPKIDDFNWSYVDPIGLDEGDHISRRYKKYIVTCWKKSSEFSLLSKADPVRAVRTVKNCFQDGSDPADAISKAKQISDLQNSLAPKAWAELLQVLTQHGAWDAVEALLFKHLPFFISAPHEQAPTLLIQCKDLQCRVAMQECLDRFGTKAIEIFDRNAHVKKTDHAWCSKILYALPNIKRTSSDKFTCFFDVGSAFADVIDSNNKVPPAVHSAYLSNFLHLLQSKLHHEQTGEQFAKLLALAKTTSDPSLIILIINSLCESTDALSCIDKLAGELASIKEAFVDADIQASLKSLLNAALSHQQGRYCSFCWELLAKAYLSERDFMVQNLQKSSPFFTEHLCQSYAKEANCRYCLILLFVSANSELTRTFIDACNSHRDAVNNNIKILNVLKAIRDEAVDMASTAKVQESRALLEEQFTSFEEDLNAYLTVKKNAETR